MGGPRPVRVSTDQQSTAWQNLVLHEAGIEDPVVFEEDLRRCAARDTGVGPSLTPYDSIKSGTQA
ncbi:hypothetical protein SNA_25095 [Streptomyces natalensis ATCC 27448]|uniref:Uncharacterized protein n=1 Tax=Streptomyces natalensis ATCC 27448 TaxID=1240678 RepID=A0A0D7CIT0_9ACTN|nr:hypothetical protein SNA_25095 [Streptomyces natalensis ATCC 27448]